MKSNPKYKQVMLHKDTTETLDACKLIPSESYDSVVKRLLAEVGER